LLAGLHDASPLVRQAARQGLERQLDERAAQAIAATSATVSSGQRGP
jgi:hypothetical protein